MSHSKRLEAARLEVKRLEAARLEVKRLGAARLKIIVDALAPVGHTVLTATGLARSGKRTRR